MKIAVVTATFNAIGPLPGLVHSLRAQSDRDFNWVVADGLSSDGTAAFLRGIDDLDLKVLEGRDFGIYDALNRAIEAADADYYIVAGADDVLDPDAIKHYRAAAFDRPDFVTAPVRYKGGLLRRRTRPSWMVGAWAHVSGHSVGCMISTRLHETHGYYSKLFPVGADQLFIKRACQAGAHVRSIDTVVGEFGSDGLSSVNTLAHLTDTFRVQYLTENNKSLQLVLFVLRLIKNKLQSRI